MEKGHAHPLGEVVEGEVATGQRLRQDSLPLSRIVVPRNLISYPRHSGDGDRAGGPRDCPALRKPLAAHLALSQCLIQPRAMKYPGQRHDVGTSVSK